MATTIRGAHIIMRRPFRDLLALLTFDPTPRTNLRYEVNRLREALAQMQHRAEVAELECKRLERIIERRERVLSP